MIYGLTKNLILRAYDVKNRKERLLNKKKLLKIYKI